MNRDFYVNHLSSTFEEVLHGIRENSEQMSDSTLPVLEEMVFSRDQVLGALYQLLSENYIGLAQSLRSPQPDPIVRLLSPVQYDIYKIVRLAHAVFIGGCSLYGKDPTTEIQATIALSVAKNHDYSPHNIAMGGLIGLHVRLNDKIVRCMNLLDIGDEERKVQDESVFDTIRDILNYSTFLVMIMGRHWYMDIGQVLDYIHYLYSRTNEGLTNPLCFSIHGDTQPLRWLMPRVFESFIAPSPSVQATV